MQGHVPTLVLRRCGQCDRPLGLRIWPWSGHLFVTTHGLCDRCYGALLAARPGEPLHAVRRGRGA